MLRQRIRVARSKLVLLGQVVTVLLALALVWYGALLGLVGVEALGIQAANAISGYRDAFDALAAIDADDVDGGTRLFTGLGGLLAFALFGWLAWKQLPRPQLVRGELVLDRDDRGEVTVAPRAFERAAEAATRGAPSVSHASGLYGGDAVSLQLAVTDAAGAAEALRDVQRRVEGSLADHGLPAVPVHVTIVKFDRERSVS